MEIHVSEPEAQALHCAVCREPFGHWSALCEDCGTRLHFGCRGLIGRCPTLGCPQSVGTAPRSEPRPRRQLSWPRELLLRLRESSWPRALAVQLGLVLALTLLATQFMTFANTKANHALADMRSLSAAVKLYRLQTGAQPRYLEDLRRRPPAVRKWGGPYIARFDRGAFSDPWGNPYVYRPYGGDCFELLSYGADGAPGGEGKAADVVLREGFPDRF